MAFTPIFWGLVAIVRFSVGRVTVQAVGLLIARGRNRASKFCMIMEKRVKAVYHYEQELQ